MSSAAAEFEVDEHGAETIDLEDEQGAQAASPVDEAPPLDALSWTPEEATALVCALWNLGIIIYGPEWAANPVETQGWNISVAQLLDIYVPKGVGGAVQLGAGMLMIGNGVMMMAARRAPIIQRGPRPLWVKREPSGPQPAAQAPAPAAPANRDNAGGRYEMPKDLVPPAKDESLNGLGL